MSFKGVNLRLSNSVPHLINLLDWEPLTLNLATLNLSNCSLSSSQLRAVLAVLTAKYSKTVTDLNLSYNILETDLTKRSPAVLLSDSSLAFCEDLITYVQTSTRIVHLDISGMQMGAKALDLVQEFSTSDSLRVVHLNNNMISYETKKFISNYLLSDYGNLKKERKTNVNLNEIGAGVRESDQGRVKLINHQLIKRVQEGVYKAKTETQDRFAKDGAND